MSKFGTTLVSRPAGREAALAMGSLLSSRNKLRTKAPIELDFRHVLGVGPSWLDEVMNFLEERKIFFIIAKTKNPSVIQSLKTIEQSKLERLSQQPKPHPWRICPIGMHWVREHPRHVPKGITIVDGHCRSNPSEKDSIYADEIKDIASRFRDIQPKPCPDDLGFGSRGSEYDNLIAGWVRYWNEVLDPKTPLDPNLVKALIASESGFNPRKAHGLGQLPPTTIQILGDESGELKDHLIHVTKRNVLEPSVNICSTVRWLHHKRALFEKATKRPLSWEDVVMKYKGYRTKNARGMTNFLSHLRRLRAR